MIYSSTVGTRFLWTWQRSYVISEIIITPAYNEDEIYTITFCIQAEDMFAEAKDKQETCSHFSFKKMTSGS